jgi:hypothetical protein
MAADTRKRTHKEAPSLGAAVDRMMRALMRRAEVGDLDAIEQLRFIRSWSSAYLAQAIQGATGGPINYSLGDIGRQLGISRQGAAQLAVSPASPGPKPGSTPAIV